MRLIHQRKITRPQLLETHTYFVDFVTIFEEPYYERMEERLHFCRQSIHALLHFAPEVLRTGSGVCSGQWPMERTIGNLAEEIRQPSNPYQRKVFNVHK